jgi:hypothetical protein
MGSCEIDYLTEKNVQSFFIVVLWTVKKQFRLALNGDFFKLRKRIRFHSSSFILHNPPPSPR